MRSIRDFLKLQGATLAVTALISSLPAAALAQRGGGSETELSLIEAELGGMERRIGALRADVSGGSLTRSSRLIGERFNEAQYAYLIEDFERCGLIFWSLLENDDLRGDPRRREAQWYLAECLYLDGNLPLALERFQRIVDVGPEHTFYNDSLLKLIELFGRTGDSRRFSEHYEKFKNSSQVDTPTGRRIRYEMARTLFRQGRLDEAQAEFSGFPSGSSYTPQARYFSGVVLTAQGRKEQEQGNRDIGDNKYLEAIEVFRETLSLPTSTPEHALVQDLAHLAIARLNYELGRIPDAVGEYNKVRPESVYYSDALYETIWANIEAAAQTGEDLASGPGGETTIPFERRKKYDEALRAIDIFNLAFPDDPRKAQLRLMQAHVRVRTAQFEDAVDRYENASRHFGSLKGLVDRIVTSQSDPMVYFNQLVDDDFVAEADLTVPEEARAKAKENAKVAEAVGIAGDLYRQQGDIEDADELLDLLEEALYQNEGVDLLQTYRLHRQQLTSAESAVLLLRQRLTDIEVATLSSYLSGSEAASLQNLSDEAGRAETPTERLARVRQEVIDKRELFELQAEAIATRMYQVRQEVERQLKTLSAAEQYLVDARKRGERSREEEMTLRNEVAQERVRLKELSMELETLDRRLEPRVLTRRLVVPQSTDDLLRSDASGSLATTESKLKRLRAGAAGGSDVFRRLDAAGDRLTTLETRAVETRGLLDQAESKEIDDIKREVDFQRNAVTALEQDSDTISRANTRVSGEIGEQAFVDVASFYEDMLTRADMGIIDVFWYRKESTSKRKKELAREKNRRLRALKDAFSDVLEDR